jgi:hypothetical protein
VGCEVRSPRKERKGQLDTWEVLARGSPFEVRWGSNFFGYFVEASMYRAGLVVVAVLTSLLGRAAEPDAGKIDQLIRQLGSDNFRDREAAGKQLEEVGEKALPALEKAATGDDAEVRRQVKRLIEAIRTQLDATARATVEKLGGEITEGDSDTGEIIVRVDLIRAKDPDIAHVKGLRHLTILWLIGTPVTDAGVAHLQELKSLQYLWLSNTKVTDAGLAHLRGLKSLQYLELSNTKVTDAGLAHLRGLGELWELILDGTPVTDEGLARLRGLKTLHLVSLADTRVTDAGLAHLRGLDSLNILNVSGTGVTDAGLDHLKGLDKLCFLILRRTKVTKKGIAHLQQHLPKVKVRR